MASTAISGIAVLVAFSGCAAAVPTQPPTQAPTQLPATTQPAQTIEIQVSHNQAATHPQNVVLQQVADRVFANTHGAVHLTIFPSSQLGTIPDLIDQFQAGADVITVHNMAQAADRGVPSLAAVSAMYAFTAPEGQSGPGAVWPVIQTFLKSDLMRGWRDELATKNFIMLAANWYLGERNIITNRPEGHPTPEDLRGITIRIPSGSTWQAYFSETPVTAVTMDGSEVYTSMQQGVIDGAEGPYGQMLGWSLQELGKSITLTGHGNDSQGFAMGQATWDKLTPDQQAALVEAFEWGGNEFSQMTVDNAATDRQRMEDAGLNFVQADVAAYRAITAAAYGPAHYPDWEPNILEKIRQASGQ
jgi:TRAP-type C4-dicarboxylate transport system substrate-binding protein